MPTAQHNIAVTSTRINDAYNMLALAAEVWSLPRATVVVSHEMFPRLPGSSHLDRILVVGFMTYEANTNL